MKPPKKIDKLLAGLIPASVAKASLFIPSKPKYKSNRKPINNN